ncbi:hypothetical protein CAP35_02855 [Chitinophagaceae bacterium IBVUCB1]|nr:hypothetical protein CAP35_02855 [Chitinophagaceae bacterium IBVUCB1]
MKKILIISNSYPNFGGQSTTAYNLLKLLQQDSELKTRLLYINYHKQADADPDNTGKSDKIALRQNLPYKIYQWYKNRFSGNSKPLYKIILILKDLYFSTLLLPRIFYQMLRKRYYPDLVITNIPVYYNLLKRVFNPQKILVLAGSSSEMYELSKTGMDAQTVLADSAKAISLLKHFQSVNYAKTNVIFNSALTRDVYAALQIPAGNARVQYFNFVPLIPDAFIPFQERRNDIAFIASLYDRSIKNAALAYNIFESMPDVKKLAIGKHNEHFANLPNTETGSIIKQTEILQKLRDTKLLIITSFFDSSPGVLSEAIMSGCNVLVSKNVGWHEKLDERCVVQNYNNLQEWIDKATHLLQHKIDYSVFIEMTANAGNNIISDIKTLARQ